jgi:hypothetical protein
VAVHFNENVPISKSDRRAITEGLVGLVSTNMPDVDGSAVLELWREPHNPLRWVRIVRLYRPEVLTMHHWANPDSGWVQFDFVDELQAAIDSKNARFDAYRFHCDECWLLIVASGSRPSGLFEPSEATLAQTYQSKFAKTVFMEAFSGSVRELKTTSA